jgi:hypothetical protein
MISLDLGELQPRAVDLVSLSPVKEILHMGTSCNLNLESTLMHRMAERSAAGILPWEKRSTQNRLPTEFSPNFQPRTKSS